MKQPGRDGKWGVKKVEPGDRNLRITKAAPKVLIFYNFLKTLFQ